MRPLEGTTLRTNLALVCVALAGCASAPLTDKLAASRAAADSAAATLQSTALAELSGKEVAGGGADAQRRASAQAERSVVRQSSSPYVAVASTPLTSPAATADPLPTIFGEQIRLAFDDRPGLRTMAERLSGVTGIAVRIKPDALAPAAAGPGGAAAPLQVPMRWTGSLAGYLDHVTDSAGLSWEYRDSTVVIERLVTRFFSLAAFEGETTYSLGMSGNDTGSGGNSSAGGSTSSTATSEVREAGKTNAMVAVMAAIKALVKDVPGSEVIRVEGSGRIAVTSTKEALAQVDAFVRAENAAMNRQAQVQFDIYTIRRSEADSRGIDWQATLQVISKAWGLKVASPTTLAGANVGSLTFNVLDSDASSANAARRFGGSAAILSMLTEGGALTEHRPVSMVGRNRQWMRKASINSRAYVSETVPSTGGISGGGAPGLKTSTVTTGDRFAVQANIQDNGTITLKFGIGLSSLVNLASFSSGAGSTLQTVQTPETSAILDQSEVTLQPGQVLAITGLSRVVSSESTRSLSDGLPLAAGGSRKLERIREDFVVLVRPSLL